MPRPLRTLALAALPAALALSAGCATTDRAAARRDFHSGRYASALERHRESLQEGGDEVVLDHCSAGTVELLLGRVRPAQRHFQEAFREMEDLTSDTGETVGAMVGSESTKRWKGDPYERCMNAYYLGVTHWMRGDPDNAAASFKTGLLRDGESEEGEARSDFGLLWLLLAEAQRDARHTDRGEFAYGRAKAVLPGNRWADPGEASDSNVLVVVELGIGPRKIPVGAHGAWVGFRRAEYAADHAEVSADGEVLGRTQRAVDLFHQATTRGEKVLDHVNQGKAVFKDAAVIAGTSVLHHSRSGRSQGVGIGLILLGLLTPAEADTRHWENLPGEVHVLRARLDEGTHELALDVRDAGGLALPDLSRTVQVEVRPGRTAFVWVRAVRPPAPAPGAPAAASRVDAAQQATGVIAGRSGGRTP